MRRLPRRRRLRYCPAKPAPASLKRREKLQNLRVVQGSLEEEGEELDPGMPPLPEEFWETLMRSALHGTLKIPVSFQLDVDILQWLKGTSRSGNWRKRMNAVLRQGMLLDLHRRSELAPEPADDAEPTMEAIALELIRRARAKL
jgi:uncharacterized protein (DUF4415 family)